MPGVVAAFSAAELGDDNAKVLCVWPVVEDIVMPEFPALAVGEVRHVGDCVAVLLATERYLAADAVEAIEVDYEPLPAVVDMEAALADGSPLVHESAGTNHCYTKHYVCGDYEKAAATADVVVKRRFVQQRLIPSPMETRAVVASPMGTSGELTIWSSTQIPHVVRVLMALTTGIPENKLRIIAPGRRRRLRRQAAVLPRGDPGDGDRQPARPAGEVDRDPAARTWWPPITAATRSSSSKWPPPARGRSSG